MTSYLIDVRVSEHGYDELADAGIRVRDVVNGLANAILVEDYPEFRKGPSVLVLQRDQAGRPIHVVWGIPRGADGPRLLFLPTVLIRLGGATTLWSDVSEEANQVHS